jgi:hypothetical protein
MKTSIKRIALAATAFGLGSVAALAEPANYPGPVEAVEAFVAALTASDHAALLVVVGPESEDLLASGDPVRDARAREEFLAGYARFHGMYEVADGKRELVIGRDLWPFPVLIVQGEAGWHFDADAAREEILSRRIGLNELELIDLLGKVAAVQTGFRAVDYDGDGVMEYASSILSTPGQRDGLYWPHEDGTLDSPLGDKIAQAAADGIAIDGVDQEPIPYLGYYFRILTQQGPDAPGGAYDYMMGGNMVGGFATLAYPADPGNTGVMSFIVGENGVIYESNLGADTLAIAAGIATFNPGEGWTPIAK